MKAAFLLAHTTAGWHLLAADSDSAAVAVQFKQVKVAGFADVAGEAADRILYFDTGGRMRRKDLDPAAAVSARREAAEAATKLAAEEAERLRAGAEELAAKLKARKIAEQAVAVIADGLQSAGQDAEPLASVPPEPAPAAAPAPESPAAAPQSAPAPAGVAGDEEDEARAHFGGDAPAAGKGGKRAR